MLFIRYILALFRESFLREREREREEEEAGQLGVLPAGRVKEERGKFKKL